MFGSVLPGSGPEGSGSARGTTQEPGGGVLPEDCPTHHSTVDLQYHSAHTCKGCLSSCEQHDVTKGIQDKINSIDQYAFVTKR